MRRLLTVLLSAGLVSTVPLVASAAPPSFRYVLDEVAVFDSGAGGGGAEIVAFDATNELILVTNGDGDRIDIFDPNNPSSAVGSLDLASYGGVQSVAVRDGLAVAAVAGDSVVADGFAVFFDPASPSASPTPVPVGALPDMVTFTPDGRYVLVANEAEPRCVDASGAGTTDPTTAVDPEGSISVIAVEGGAPTAVRTADFRAFNDDKAQLQLDGVRLTWPGATVAQDLEPEYITVDKRSRTAFVSLQENNALAVVDIRAAQVTDVVALGVKDYDEPGNEIDASDRDPDEPNLRSWPVAGMYQPDGLDSWSRADNEYLVTANEGDGREYFNNLANDEDAENAELCFVDEARVKDLTLDAAAFPNAADLQKDENLGRLKVSQVALSAFSGGLPPTDGTDPKDVPGLTYSRLAAYGARSITIWGTEGDLIWDSGSALARTVAAQDPDGWTTRTAPWAEDVYDDRSDDKGVEPESVVHGKAYGRDLLFVGLERAGGIVTFDATDPGSPVQQQWTTSPGAVSPEGLAFVSDEDSHTGRPLLLVAHEGSGTTVMYEVTKQRG